MRKHLKKMLSMLMVVSMLMSTLATVSYANETPPAETVTAVELVFEYPEDVPKEEVDINVYKGIPSWYLKYGASDLDAVPEALASALEEIEPDEAGKYIADEAGGYCYYVRGKEKGEYYNIIKLFIVNEEDVAAGSKTLPVKTGPSAGTGFETGTNNPVGENGETAPEGFDQGVQHLVPVEGTDEMEHLLGTEELKGYVPFTTPAFEEGRHMYQATTQQEMMDFIAEYADDPYMHVYSAGTTSNLKYDLPVLVFTKKEIPEGASMDEVAQILKDGGLPIIWQQAQIHPYEPAAGESALVMIQELCGEYGEDILDDVDVVMIPRVNVEGGFLFWRGDYSGTDMNRDHMVVSTEQNAMLHDVYYKFMPHVVIDNHEFFFSEMGNYQGDSEKFELNDFQITGATSLNDDATVTDLTVEVVDKMHADLIDTGFRAFHYGITSNNPIGRAYYGLTNAISILIESHGADGALFAFPRRVYGQVVSTKSVYEATAERADEIIAAVDAARADVAEKGATYEEDDVLVLKQSASGAKTSPTPLDRYVADIYGNIESIGKEAINLQDTIVRSRTRPTAYFVDASEEWADDLCYILDHHGAEYFELPAGTTAELQQYYYIEKDGTKSCIADVREAAEVTFAEGAIMVPMDQVSGNVIGMLMEPDVGDSARYNGTLFQYGLLKYDETTMNMPLYRYTKDNPRNLVYGVTENVDDAILYTVDAEGNLEYNVVYEAAVAAEPVVTDRTGNGIDSLAELTEALGTPEALGDAVVADLGLDADGKIVTVAVNDVSERPIVGISWKSNTQNYSSFLEAFDRNGAKAVELPQIVDPASARAALAEVDGIFVTGGEDWNPALYGEEAYIHGSSGWNDVRDLSDINLMQQAIALDVPMLCVCRGEQGLNVALGGGLIQDVPTWLGQQVKAGNIDESRVTGVLEDVLTSYKVNPDGSWSVEKVPCDPALGHYRVQVDGLIHSGGTSYHELAGGVSNEGIAIDENSKWLYDIVGADSIDMIATAHHQSANPEKLGKGLTVVAKSSDGIIEALEYQDNLFALALQWHPERDALGGTKGEELGVDVDLSNAFLRALVEHAAIEAKREDPDYATVSFTYPDGIVEDEVSVEFYKGFPTSSSRSLEQTISRGELTELVPNYGDGTYTITEPGTYAYHISGEGYYNILKLVNINDAEIASGEIEIELTGGKLGTGDGLYDDGFQPTAKPSQAPDTYKMDARDAMLCIWPDEILEKAFDINKTTHEPGSYDTPAFQGTDALHQVTTQDELMAFVADRDAKCDYMYQYSAGATPNYGFDIPLAIFTTTAIPEGATLEEAAALVKGNGKTTVWYQTQIHPNEPASGEAALVIIDNFIKDPEAKALLEDINLVIVPRINPDGSYLFSRATYDGFDMNRDHMSLKAAELAQLHTVYRLFMAEVVLDGHEFTFYGAGGSFDNGYMSNADDVQSTPATSLNNDPAVTEIALEMAGDAFQDATDAGLRIYHYGTTVNNPIGRAYFGLYDCLSFLIETRGIGAGRTNFERRVFSQETVIMSYIEGTAERAEEIKQTVAESRARTIEKGKVYDEDDLLYIYQTASGQTKTDYAIDRYQFAMDGSVHKVTPGVTLNLNDTGTRTRIRPTAYVIPADIENIDKILYIMKNQGAEYYELEAGTVAELEQYYYVGDYMYNGRARGIEAGLRDAAAVAFENGAYVFPMDQVAADVIAMLVEPDVTDSNGYDGTLYQYGVVKYDETTKNFPLYRYTKDNARETLVSNDGTAKLTLTYPAGIAKNEVTIEVYKGFPTSASYSLDQMISAGQLVKIEANEDGTYTLPGAGTYSYHISGDGYYNILKIFNVYAEDIISDAMSIELTGGKLGTGDGKFDDGFQPTAKPSQAPDTYKMDARDAMLCIWPDEILESAFDINNTTHEPGSYDTPAFDGTDALHQVTTQDEMMAFVADRDAKCDYMYQYSAGTTPNYGFDIPMAIFTTTPIPAGSSLEEAAALVKGNGKTTVWYQTQIHPNEPASGEAALVIIDRFINDPETKALLDDINVVIVPRINPDGSYLFSRATYDGFDMNRDHMSLKAAELAQLHTVYRLFMAEVVLDGHEFTFYGAGTNKENGKGYMSNADDVQSTPATSLNNDAAVTEIALEMAGDAFQDATDAGLRIYHYGTTVNNPIGRAYFGLYDCLSFLIETRGIGAGKTNFERRVFSQETVIMSYIEGTAERAEEIKETVAEARARTVEKGKIYDEDDLLYIYQTASGETKTEYTIDRYRWYMDGTEWLYQEDVALNLNDTGTRTRVRPTAYVIPADIENIDKILYIMDNQGAEYYELEPGTAAELEQYYYVGTYKAPNGSERGIEAGLRKEAKVTFANGAYVFPMDQVAADVIAMLVEPDVTDSNGYDGTLYQYGVVTYDEATKNFPLYRYTKNNARKNLVSNDGTLSSGGDSSKPAIRDDVEVVEKPEAPAATFVDVPATHWAYTAVEAVAKAGLFNGTSATTFSPEADTTRGQLMTVLARLSGAEAKTIEQGVAWAVANGVSDGTNPEAKITREQLVTMLYRYAQLKGMDVSVGENTNILSYEDAASVSEWAIPAMQWAVGSGVIKGMTETTLVPGANATRAQVATIMQRYAGL